jgi:hypothetical protein
MATKIQVRRDTIANWASANPILSSGEIGMETDASPVRFKIGNGTTTWNSLAYFGNGAGDMMVSVYDPTSVEADVFDVDNHNDGSINGVYTLAERTKLSGIEAGADITDATNVGGIIHAASADTLADAYEFGFWNTVSGLLKNITWANIKATLKTYFDTLYASASNIDGGNASSF